MTSITDMPQSVQNAYIQAVRDGKPENWLSIVRLAIKSGVTDPDKLADIPFYLSHPELMNRPLKAHETKLISAWIATRNNIVPMVKAVLRSSSDPDLTRWLELLNTSWIKPRTEHETAETTRQRQKSLERMRVFMAKASAAPHEYDTVYRQYKYYDGFGRPRAASERTHQVGAFEKTGTQNAFSNLQRAAEQKADDFRDFGPVFADMEFAVYSHTDVVLQWVRGGATNDGPTKSNAMEDELNWLASQSKRSRSIYSVYRSDLVSTHKAFNDTSPGTAGLPNGFGSWDDWRKVWDDVW